MGVDPVTAAIVIGVATAGAGVVSSRQAAKSQMAANAQEATNVAENLRRQAVVRAADLQAGFLSSGLLLQGTPSSLVQQTYDVAQEDIFRTFSNARAANQAIARNARNQAIKSILAGAQAGFSVYGGLSAGANAPVGADAFSANTAATTTQGGIRLPAGLPRSTGG